MKGERQDAAWIQGPDRSKAFTLIELLTVIVIIGLLVGMIAPSLIKARTMARVARTQGLLNTLGSGLEMFQADQALGEEYPPSYYWDANHPMPVSIGSGEAYGAHTLVWGLAGADLMGTVGFTGDLAALYSPTSTAVRRGPFVDLSHMQVGYAPKGEIPDDVSRNYRVILDSFGMPILYFRADPRQSDPQKIYTREHNLNFFSANTHPLGKSTSTTSRDGTMTRSNAFLLYTWDSRVAQATNYSKYAPYNRDKYLLISAGPDMQYGTDDDVTNFMLDTNKNLANP